GASLNIEKIFQEGYSVARRGNLWNRISERISLFSKPLQISESIRYKEESFNLFYGKLQEWVERPTRDAQLVSSKVISSEVGVEINRIELLKELTNTIINQPESSDIVNKIIIPVNLQKPLISTNEILNQMETNQLLSTYETSLAGKEENTLFNIKKAAADANGIILKPGETFFFNQLIGPAEKEDGYKESIIISNGQFTSGYGGGVCQVSTTIYNAALLANLQIIERYNHSIYGDATSYVPLGQDSAVFYGYKDLKFKNNLEQQIVIFSEVEKDKLIVRILGEQSLDVNIKIITEDKQIIDYDIIELKRENGNYIENRILQEGIPGYQITTYRLITGSQGERREFISRDQYISVPQKIIVD
ncbi:MAG: VanW family protein, partial [Atribacterota bacterium]|nr:VanW family protein [Atribacterota bacterium]